MPIIYACFKINLQSTLFFGLFQATAHRFGSAVTFMR